MRKSYIALAGIVFGLALNLHSQIDGVDVAKPIQSDFGFNTKPITKPGRGGFDLSGFKPVMIDGEPLTGMEVNQLRFFNGKQLAAFLLILDATPLIPTNLIPPRVGGTFWSLQQHNMPPWPGNVNCLPAWKLGDGTFLMSDLDFDYSGKHKAKLSLSFDPKLSVSAHDIVYSTPLPDYGTNLWIAQVAVAGGYLTAIASNTLADVQYEVQSRTNLLQTDWQTEGFINGSELTNWTALSVVQADRPILFLHLRSWIDSYGIGIPDWWQIQYFGTNGIDPDASAAGDAFSNLEKFQMGLNPTNYYNTNPPSGFFGCLDASGTNILIEWSPSPGPVVNYIVQRGIRDVYTGNYSYSQIATLSSNATFFKDVGAMTNANAEYNIYNLSAVYPAGNTTGTNSWTVWWYIYYGNYGPPNGPPIPNDVYAYAALNGTNVSVSWTPALGGAPTNYIISRGILTSGNYTYSQIASVNTNTITFQDVGVIKGTNDWNNMYQVRAIYPEGGLSQPVSISINTNLPPPTRVSANVDSTGTNVAISWTSPSPSGLTATNYIIERGIYNTNTGNYDYSQIGQVSSSVTNFVDTGAITGNNSLNNVYQVRAVYSGNVLSPFSNYYLPGPPPNPIYNLRVSAQLVRGPNGKWQVAFSQIPSSIQSFNFIWSGYGYYSDMDDGVYEIENISASSLTNGCYTISDSDVAWLSDSAIIYDSESSHLYVQAVGTNGILGATADVGFINIDAPYFVDGRQHLKQNLLFKLRAATMSQPCTVTNSTYHGNYIDELNYYSIPAPTNYVESSIFHWAYQYKQYGNDSQPGFVKMSGLWPFNENYQLHQRLYDSTNPSVPSDFIWTNNFLTVPAPAVLGIGNPYWISQDFGNLADVAAYTNSGNLYLQNGYANLFGLQFQNALVNLGGFYWYWDGAQEVLEYAPNIITLSPGGSTGITNVSDFYSQTVTPSLQANGYYFSVVNTPGTSLAGNVSGDKNQPAPLPCLAGFSSTNQTGIMVASVGSPAVVGGWAKYSIQNGASGKYAYLGQYFTNALVVTNGAVTSNKTGILSPYGNFFPTQAGLAALVTMPDLDTGAQGTGIVRVVSLNVDANHDGTMDFTYQGPDFVSQSKPFRFWANDNIDSGDFGGNFGMPGQLYGDSDGSRVYVHSTSIWTPGFYNSTIADDYKVNGRRDLVDFFPVYLNIGSLFQNAASSAGIDPNDFNYQYALSQADGVLRFVYTDLTATNYMSFLLDTNKSGILSGASAIAIPVLTNGTLLDSAFIAKIATNNQGIILVEAAAPTTKPLVLTIYRGTNQIAKTSLPLSITGIEQMFRHKNLLLSASPAKPDRLTDADVPNEPDTIARNFVFMHGYNVDPEEARGVQSDMFKRMYWSGSHAKFYAVTWQGADTKIGNVFTPNYHTNVYNAFQTANSLANFIANLTNSGPVVASAHSLGNMLTLSAISDWKAPISKFFMMDAAVPIEAIDPTATTNMMIYSTWTGYSNWLYASDWYQLFPTNDARSTLNWNGRLSNITNVDVYNFYSSGEDILRLAPGDPPISTLNILATTLINRFSLFGLWPKVPFGTYSWYWQEKGKGNCNEDWLIGSSHGGWRFSDYYYGLPVSSANSTAYTPTSMLPQHPFFDFSRAALVGPPHPDLALTNAVTGSAYAAANRNRILSDAIPAMSQVAGANPVPKFTATDHNIDMMTLKNGWSLGRAGDEGGMWHHSDFVQMAYTFTYPLFNQFVTTGNLK